MATAYSLPAEMKAAAVDHFGPPDVVHTATLPVPKLGRAEVLIRVEAAGIGSWDPSMVDGSFTDVKRKLPTVFGSDGAGVIVATGPGVDRFAPGDRVYGWGFGNKKGGFFAEFAVVNERDVARMPDDLPFEQAGALAVAGITALDGLDAIALEPGDDVLIVGASGGVGHIALQLSKLLDLRAFAVASGSDGVQLVKELGADGVAEGHAASGAADAHRFAPDGFDGALVFAGGDGWESLLSLVKPGAKVAWPNGVEPAPKVPRGVHKKAYDGEDEPEAFTRLNALISGGPFRVEVSHLYALDEVAQALRDVQKHHVGKLALKIH